MALTFEEARVAYPNLQHFLSDLYLPFSPGGERRAAFQLAFSDTLARIIASHPGKRIAVVPHCGVIEVSFRTRFGL